MLRFRLLGIPFEITLFFWIGSAIFGSSILTRDEKNGMLLLALWVLCVFVSIVAHELGHALAGKRYGLQPHVALYQFGGLTFLPGGSLTRLQHIVVSLAGPAAGFLVYLAVRASRHLLGVAGEDDLLHAPTQTGLIVQNAVNFLLYINGFWTLVNLLPIMPLDGGQVLRDVLGPRLIGVSRAVGAVCAVLVCLWAASSGRYIMAFFLGYLAYQNLVGDTRSLPGGVDR